MADHLAGWTPCSRHKDDVLLEPPHTPSTPHAICNSTFINMPAKPSLKLVPWPSRKRGASKPPSPKSFFPEPSDLRSRREFYVNSPARFSDTSLPSYLDNSNTTNPVTAWFRRKLSRRKDDEDDSDTHDASFGHVDMFILPTPPPFARTTFRQSRSTPPMTAVSVDSAYSDTSISMPRHTLTRAQSFANDMRITSPVVEVNYPKFESKRRPGQTWRDWNPQPQRYSHGSSGSSDDTPPYPMTPHRTTLSPTGFPNGPPAKRHNSSRPTSPAMLQVPPMPGSVYTALPKQRYSHYYPLNPEILAAPTGFELPRQPAHSKRVTVGPGRRISTMTVRERGWEKNRV